MTDSYKLSCVCSGGGRTFGTAACSNMFRMGNGAVLSSDTTMTRTSGRAGGQSIAKCIRTRTPSLSYTVTGKTLPEDTTETLSLVN